MTLPPESLELPPALKNRELLLRGELLSPFHLPYQTKVVKPLALAVSVPSHWNLIRTHSTLTCFPAASSTAACFQMHLKMQANTNARYNPLPF